jgi:outer membrane protein OmpA-like peptidoglycan-associated protein
MRIVWNTKLSDCDVNYIFGLDNQLPPMPKRLLFAIFILNVLGFRCAAQYWTGMNGSAYMGVTTVDFNPAIADSRFIVDVNLFSIATAVNNNYVGLDRYTLLHWNDLNDPNFQADHLLERVNGHDKDVYLGMQVQGPLSFMFSFGKGLNKNKNAIAVSYHSNFIFNGDKISEIFARSAYYGLGYKADSVTDFLGKNITNGNINFRTMAWNDYGITYSRVILEQGAHMVKVGGTLKLIQGLVGGYVYVKNLNYQWPKYDTLSIFKANVNYAYSQGMISSQGYQPDNFGNNHSSYTNFSDGPLTAAVDFGAIYEWRPQQDKYKKDEDGAWRAKNRYTLSAGVSVVDFGAARFKEGEYSENFTADITNWSVKNATFPAGLQSVDDTIHSRFQITPSKSYFSMWLPTRINGFLDYNSPLGLGANFSTTISPNMAPKRNMVHEVTNFAITPKYENEWFGVYLPLTYDVMGNFNLGTSIRVGPLLIGTQDILAFFARKYFYNEEVHAGLKITIPYHKKILHKTVKAPPVKDEAGDRDHDGVPDDQDRCPDVPGPIELHGCPDADGDGIPDIDDSCPLERGLLINHGCPDRDSDGVWDKYDECPDVPGLAQFNGCPDRDSDGVPDKLDLCPEQAGPVEHHGCPDTDKDGVFDDEDRCILTPGPAENQGCPWPDRDGDGIPDKDDLCPDVFGVPENHGCPKLEKKEAETIKYAFENLEFETGKDVLQEHSYASLTALAKLLKDKPNYGLRIEGHTDNVGSDVSNLILSQKRANAVKDFLLKKGVDGSKLETIGYGASKPIGDNDTPDGRQKNRRVELNVTFR